MQLEICTACTRSAQKKRINMIVRDFCIRFVFKFYVLLFIIDKKFIRKFVRAFIFLILQTIFNTSSNLNNVISTMMRMLMSLLHIQRTLWHTIGIGFSCSDNPFSRVAIASKRDSCRATKRGRKC